MKTLNKIILIFFLLIIGKSSYAQMQTTDLQAFAQRAIEYLRQEKADIQAALDASTTITEIRNMIDGLTDVYNEVQRYADAYDEVRSKLEKLEELEDVKLLDFMYAAEIILGRSLNPSDYLPRSKYFYNDIGYEDLRSNLDWEYANPNSTVNFIYKNWILDYPWDKVDYTKDAAKNEMILTDSLMNAIMKIELERALREYQMACQTAVLAKELYDLSNEDDVLEMTKAERANMQQDCIDAMRGAEEIKLESSKTLGKYRMYAQSKFSTLYYIKDGNNKTKELINKQIKQYRIPNEGFSMRNAEKNHVKRYIFIAD